MRLRHHARTPWHFCGDCTRRATDARGWPLQFIGLGAEWSYRSGCGPDAHGIGPQIACLIDGRPVLVSESRQGGVVAVPLIAEHLVALQSAARQDGGSQLSSRIVDLTRADALDAVLAQHLTRPGRAPRF